MYIGNIRKDYQDMSVGERLIVALKQAVDYERGKKVKGVKVRKVSTPSFLEIKNPNYKAKSSR